MVLDPLEGQKGINRVSHPVIAILFGSNLTQNFCLHHQSPQLDKARPRIRQFFLYRLLQTSVKWRKKQSKLCLLVCLCITNQNRYGWKSSQKKKEKSQVPHSCYLNDFAHSTSSAPFTASHKYIKFSSRTTVSDIQRQFIAKFSQQISSKNFPSEKTAQMTAIVYEDCILLHWRHISIHGENRRF